MFRALHRVLRLIMFMGKQSQLRSLKSAGGLMCLLWTEDGCAHVVNCTVAAAGPWFKGIQMKELQTVFADMKESRFPGTCLCPHPDPEELCAFTELYGSLKVLVSFQIKIHLKFKFNQQTIQPEFRVKNKIKVAQAGDVSLILDVTCNIQPPEWALCATVVVYSPSNIPITRPSIFLQDLPAHLDYEDLSLHSLHSSSFKDLWLKGGNVYAVEQDNWEGESSLPTMQQSLLLFLFLQHTDPFTSQLSDVLATEELIEHHLEDILSNNSQAVTTALQTELKNTLKAEHHRKKGKEKLGSGLQVILSSSICIVSCSSNMDFRNACLNSMKVRDTHELSASLCESLRSVTSWKFTPRSRCYSAQMEEQPEVDGPTRAEI
ncbi:type 2 DNA topoisomerase 6 subunit B-like isoform X1 [Solea senegalensis]|uniref:Type 2 DNA topoisomerase 6 subunit B-like isoform X1 n=1 Tax=Solea senegalensis TaxID=28829 RepID=A0AAV6SIL6_SOLSE|nr:type 2 DNA topoisomerase 6 subunit B-like isoform X1 [Solea senegalensis]